MFPLSVLTQFLEGTHYGQQSTCTLIAHYTRIFSQARDGLQVACFNANEHTPSDSTAEVFY